MFVTNWISTTKIQKISEITNFFRHYFLSRTEVGCEPPPGLSPFPVPPGLVPPPFGSLSGSSTSPLSPEVTFFTTLPLRSMQVICIGVLCSSSLISTFGVKITRRAVMRLPATSPTVATLLARTPNRMVPRPGIATEWPLRELAVKLGTEHETILTFQLTHLDKGFLCFQIDRHNYLNFKLLILCKLLTLNSKLTIVW